MSSSMHPSSIYRKTFSCLEELKRKYSGAFVVQERVQALAEGYEKRKPAVALYAIYRR